RGVNSGAAAGTWQAHMYLIITGVEPMFYLDYDGSAYTLLDGLSRDFGGVDTFLRVNGDYPPGTYTFDGTIEDIYGGTAGVTVQIEFYLDQPELTTLDLVQSLDQATWTPVDGSLASGFTMPLDPANDYYYLDVANVTTDHPLAVDAF